MNIVKDKISVAYSSLEDLLERQEVIEDRVTTFIEDNPSICSIMRSTIRIGKGNYILEVELIKD